MKTWKIEKLSKVRQKNYLVEQCYGLINAYKILPVLLMSKYVNILQRSNSNIFSATHLFHLFVFILSVSVNIKWSYCEKNVIVIQKISINRIAFCGKAKMLKAKQKTIGVISYKTNCLSVSAYFCCAMHCSGLHSLMENIKFEQLQLKTVGCYYSAL